MIIIDPVSLGDVAITRASVKYVYDRSGKVVQVAANTLAVTYDPADLTKAPYALIEAAATNAATWSQDYTNAAWTKTQLTVIADAAVAPDGATTADKLVPTASNSYHALSRGFSVVAGKGYTWSRYVKSAGYSFLYVRFADALQYQTGNSSGVSPVLAQSIHSGNVVAACRYDVSKDSDSGAWIGRCQLTSWYNEAIVPGKWLGQQANGSGSAIAAAGGVAGDYFQYTGDGKFYQVVSTAGSGTFTEVFRGNSRQFPALAAVIAESGRVIIYDLTQPGCPMWMVFVGAVNVGMIRIGISSVVMLNGQLWVGCAGPQSLTVTDFVADSGYFIYTSQTYTGPYLGNISARNAAMGCGGFGTKYGQIINNSVNSIAATVLSGAPIDSTSGLPIPTIAVATAGGVSVIKSDGTVVNSGLTSETKTCSISGSMLFLSNRYNTVATARFIDLTSIAAGWTPSSYPLNFPNLGGNMDETRVVATGPASSASGHMSAYMSLVKLNTASPANSIRAIITNTYNTGWMVGDVRGCWMADTVAETITGAELVTNGTFTTDTSGWVTGTLSATAAAVAGEMQVTPTADFGRRLFVFPTTVGKQYVITGSARVVSGPGTAFLGYSLVDPVNGSTALTVVSTTSTTAVSGTVTFTATATSVAVVAGENITGTSSVYGFDNISCRLAVPDRSVKGRGLQVYGSLTKVAVAAGAQLVGYSGFSAANYLEQPYNTDFDIGTGDFCVMGWIKVVAGANSYLFDHASPTGTSRYYCYVTQSTGTVNFSAGGGAISAANVLGDTNSYHHVAVLRLSGATAIFVDGVKVANGTDATGIVVDATATFTPGMRYNKVEPVAALVLMRAGATTPSADDIAQIYRDELALFQPGAQNTLDGTSSAITALAYDDSTSQLHVATSWGRSAFNSLVRTESAATSVGTIAALAAGGSAHITGGASAGRAVQPATSYPAPGAVDRGAVFDLSTGAMVASDLDKGVTAAIQPVGSGQYRVSLSATAGVTGTGTVHSFVAQDAAMAPSLTPYFSGDGASGMYAWQDDFVDSATVGSPIPATAATVTRAAESIASGAGVVYSNVAIAEPAYSAGTTYAISDVVYDPATYLTYTSMVAANTGNALTDPTKWSKGDVINRRKMLDQYNNTQTSSAEEILLCASPQAISAGIYLGNVDATEIRLSVVDLVDGLVYQETQSLVTSNSDASFYNWGFRRIKRRSYAVSVALPPYANALITIAIRKPGGTAKCGVCVIGPLVDVGLSMYGLSREIRDFSTINFNFDGTSNQVIRNFAKRMDIDVLIANDQIDSVIENLEGYRQKPVAWIGAKEFGSACIFGRYSSFKNVIQNYPLSQMNLQIEGTV
jgi:trimeric autotransporter adhesin